mmetsp:Transcript_20681/g.2775  ORF Transcript_20681/g.2775 Transcript_20681/m.2775 type:complete len:95 (-) Transcript_20681:648-932(-)
MNYEGFFNNINEIPIINSPSVFGLHPNAEITYYTNSAKSLWDNLISMQSSVAAGSSESDRDSFIERTADGISEKLPPVWDIIMMRKEKEELSPT